MKVLLIFPFRIDVMNWNLTGDTNMASNILYYMNKDGVEIDIAGNFSSLDGDDELIKDLKECYHFNQIIDVSEFAVKRDYIKRGFELLKDCFDSYDLIHIHNSNPSIISKITTYLKGYKVIFSLHAPPENSTFQFYHRDQYLEFLNDENSCLVCVSESHAERCLKALNYYKEFPEGTKKPNIHFILNGISPKEFSSKRVYDCGTIGRFSPSKSSYESIRCVAEITKHTGGSGFVVGTTSSYEGSTENERLYRAKIYEVLKENPQIYHYEKLTSHEIQILLSKTKCYINLSTIETFGLTICEALMQGTPCIGFDVNGIGELIIEGKNGYKFKKSREKWESRIKSSVNLYEKCLTLDNKEIRDSCVEKYDIKRTATSYYNLYTKMIEGGGTNS